MRTTIVSVCLAAAVCVLPAWVFAADVKRVAPEDFAILPWGGTNPDPAVLKEIADCGFNLAGFVRPEGLDAVKAAGLKCIVSGHNTHVGDAEAGLDESEIVKRVEPLVRQVSKHPAVFGYYLRDEPTAHRFPGLAKWVSVYRRFDPDARCYVNLFPNVASIPQLGVKTYDEYVESFVTTVKPSFVSYDHYALMDDGSLKDGYFQNLESVRNVALKHNLPFWNIVLSNSHFHYAEPSENGLRFQAYTTLAYGARGISYFTYFAPATGNYRLAPIDQFGHKTQTWDMLRSVNLQIHQLAPTYLKLKSVNVFHHPEVPNGCQGLADSRFVAELSGGRFVVGEFEGPEGRPFVMVVNKDLHTSALLGIRFKQNGRVMHTNSYTGATHPWDGEDRWFAAGQGMLLSLAK